MFKVMTDLDLAEGILTDDNLELTHKHGDSRLVSDTLDALSEVLDMYAGYEESGESLVEENEAMRKHIEKLEKMLDRRNIRYKTWEEVELEL